MTATGASDGTKSDDNNNHGTATPCLQPISLDNPSVAREVQKKQRLMEQSRQHQSSRRRRPQDHEDCETKLALLPAGQNHVSRWIILDLGLRPPQTSNYSLDEDSWSLELIWDHYDGSSSEPITLTLQDLLPLCQSYPNQNWHCVTGWSATNLNFEGVPFAKILQLEKVQKSIGSTTPSSSSSSSWKWLFQESADGYTVPVSRQDMCIDENEETCRQNNENGHFTAAAASSEPFLAVRYNGEIISMDHGGPRLCIPHLYGWKSAKWTVRWRFMKEYKPGFWEKLGCHARGRIRREERFQEGWITTVWNTLTFLAGLYRIIFGKQVWIFIMTKGGAMLGKIVQAYLPWLHSGFSDKNGAEKTPSNASESGHKVEYHSHNKISSSSMKDKGKME